jgi:hypothetical protein
MSGGKASFSRAELFFIFMIVEKEKTPGKFYHYPERGVNN